MTKHDLSRFCGSVGIHPGVFVSCLLLIVCLDLGVSGSKAQIAPDLRDTLFDQLRTAPSEDVARSVRSSIDKLIRDSGSESINLIMLRAETAASEGDHVFAYNMLDTVTELAPDYAFGWLRRAQLHVLKGDNDAAFRDIDTALVIEPRYITALLLRAELLKKEGDLENSKLAFAELLSIDPYNPEVSASERNFSVGSP